MRIITCLLFALSLSAQPKFEVASVKYSGGILARPIFEPTSLSLRNEVMTDLLQQAYGISLWQLDWRAGRGDPTRYDVDAKWNDPADKWQAMLQELLKERFSLVVRMEQRPTMLYTLSVDPKKRDLLEKCKASPEDVGKRRIERPRQDLGEETIHYIGAEMDLVWQSVGSSPVGSMKGRIVRETGIEGSYTMTIDKPNGATSEDLFFAAKRSFTQCGLEIKTVEKPVPFLVVTSAGKLIPN